jgi:hypothetical protein
MKTFVSQRREYFWLAATAVVSLPLVFALCQAIWHTPYPIGETIALLEDDLNAPSPAGFFDPTIRSWYRPLFHSTWWTLWRLTGSLDGTLFWFKIVELSAIVALVALFLWYLRPRTLLESAAATFGVAVLVGMPGLRTNLELPVLMTLVGMPMAMLVWILLEHEPRWWHPLAIVSLTFLAIGYKEQGW